MKSEGITIPVALDGIENAISKGKELINTLEKAIELIDELNSVEISINFNKTEGEK